MTLNRLVPPAVHEFGPLYLAPDTITMLPNGITLHTVSGGDSEANRLTIAIPGGEAEFDVPGLAQLTSKLLLDATEHHSAYEMANILELNGAWTGTSVTVHYTSVDLFSMNSKFFTLLPLVREMIVEPAFEAEAVSQHIRRTVAKLKINMKKVAWQTGQAVKPLAYGPDSTLSKTPTPESLASITPEQIKAAHQARLDPTEMHIFLSGKVTQAMIQAVIDVFSTIPQVAAPFERTPLNFQDTYPVHSTKIVQPDSVQSSVRFMLPSVGRVHPDFIPMRMAVTALGGYFGSRLMLNIREDQGLTYGISASLLGYRERSFIQIASQTDPANVDRLIESVKEELNKMKDPASYTDEEVTRLRRFALSSLAAILDTPFSRMDYLQTAITADTPPDYFALQEQTARALSPNLLAEMATKYFDPNLLLYAVAGQ